MDRGIDGKRERAKEERRKEGKRGRQKGRKDLLGCLIACMVAGIVVPPLRKCVLFRLEEQRYSLKRGSWFLERRVWMCVRSIL